MYVYFKYSTKLIILSYTAMSSIASFFYFSLRKINKLGTEGDVILYSITLINIFFWNSVDADPN